MLPETQATAFEIEVLDGAMKGTVISLEGTALPFRDDGVSFSSKQRSKTTYYPGNPVASQQVFGATQENTTITGVWHDHALGDGGARELVKQLRYVCEHGLPVEVRWGGAVLDNYSDEGIVQRGIIKMIDPKYQMPQIIAWTIEFEWSGAELVSVPPTFAGGPSAISTKADEFGFLSDSLADTTEEVSSWRETAYIPINAGVGALALINDTLDNVQTEFAETMTVLDYAADVIIGGAELPGSVMERVRGACARVVATNMNLRAAFDAVAGLWPARSMIAGVTLSPAALTGADWYTMGRFVSAQAKEAKLAIFPTDDPLEQMDGMNQQFSLMQSSDAMAEKCMQQASALAAQIHPAVIAEERPPAGTDLRDLAVRYYGDAELWVIIADFNDLDTSLVPSTPMGPSDNGSPPILIPDATAYAAASAAVWGAP